MDLQGRPSNAGLAFLSLGRGAVKLYTRTGDAGTTSLADGTRVGKDDLRPEACGSLDELNAHLGLARSICRDEELSERLTTIQNELFSLGCDLGLAVATSPQRKELQLTDASIRRLEHWIDQATEGVPPLEQFILPAGEELACRLHVARTVCRRAERRIVSLAAGSPVSEATLKYVNRLSDLLYAWARQVNHAAGRGDVPVDFGQRP
jgi:cob(I)alamin adenosyltransferase